MYNMFKKNSPDMKLRKNNVWFTPYASDKKLEVTGMLNSLKIRA